MGIGERIRKRLSDFKRRFGVGVLSDPQQGGREIWIGWAEDFIEQLAEMEDVPEPKVTVRGMACGKWAFTPGFMSPDTIRISGRILSACDMLGGLWGEYLKYLLAHEFKHYLQRYRFEPEKVSLKGWKPTTLMPPSKEEKKWKKYSQENELRLEREANKYALKHSGLTSSSEAQKMHKAWQMLLMEYINKNFGPYGKRELYDELKKDAPWIKGREMREFLTNHPEIARLYKNPLEYLPSMEERFG